MSSFLVFVFFLILDRLAGYVAASRRSAPDARAWKEVVLGTHCWLLGVVFASMGRMLMMQGFLADSTLGRAAVALGAAVALLAAVFFLYGASTFMTARDLFRDARRSKDEIPL